MGKRFPNAVIYPDLETTEGFQNENLAAVTAVADHFGLSSVDIESAIKNLEP